MSSRTATIELVWPKYEEVFFRNLVDAAVKTSAFRGVRAAELYAPFREPAINFYRTRRDLEAEQSVKLVVSFAVGANSPVTIRPEMPEGTVPATAADVPPAAPLDAPGESLIRLLEQCNAWNAVVDFVVAPARLDLQLFQALPGGPTKGDRVTAPARKAVTALVGLLRVAQVAPNPKIYSARFTIRNGAWILESTRLIAEVHPVPQTTSGSQADTSFDFDEGKSVIEDIHGSRRLVLDTAAMLIAEQDPTRFDNMVMAIAPFAVLKVGKIAKLAKLSKGAVLNRIRAPRAVQLRRPRYHVDVPINKAILDRALELRKTKYGVELGDFRRNVTVWEVSVDGKTQFMDAGNVPIRELNAKYGKGDVDLGFHSEPLVAREVKRLKDRGSDVKVVRIYTERICCARCTEIIDRDDMFRNVPIYYTVGKEKGDRAALLMERYGVDL